MKKQIVVTTLSKTHIKSWCPSECRLSVINVQTTCHFMILFEEKHASIYFILYYCSSNDENTYSVSERQIIAIAIVWEKICSRNKTSSFFRKKFEGIRMKRDLSLCGNFEDTAFWFLNLLRVKVDYFEYYLLQLMRDPCLPVAWDRHRIFWRFSQIFLKSNHPDYLLLDYPCKRHQVHMMVLSRMTSPYRQVYRKGGLL